MSYTYQVQGKTIELAVDPSVIAVRFRNDEPLSARARAAKAWSTVEPNRGVEIPDENVLIVPSELLREQAGSASREATEATIRQLRCKPDILDAMPIFKVGKYRVLATRRIVIGLFEAALGREVAKDFDLKIRETRSDKIVCDVPAGIDVFELVAKLDADEDVRFAEPDLITLGFRSKADAGSSTAAGSKGRAVHGQSPNGAGGYTGTGARPSEKHRADLADLTHKIAAGRMRVQDHATGSEQMAVRIVPTSLPGGRWKTTNTIIARSIDWSRKAGADILTNTWVSALPSNDVMEELERARTLGRGGLGCVIVVSAETGGASTEFPATLPNVLTMDAGERYEPHRTTSHSVGQNGVGNRRTDAAHDGRVRSTKPNLSGACALVLAANPDLTEEQVRDLIGQATTPSTGAVRQPESRTALPASRTRSSLISAVQSALVATQ